MSTYPKIECSCSHANISNFLQVQPGYDALGSKNIFIWNPFYLQCYHSPVETLLACFTHTYYHCLPLLQRDQKQNKCIHNCYQSLWSYVTSSDIDYFTQHYYVTTAKSEIHLEKYGLSNIFFGAWWAFDLFCTDYHLQLFCPIIANWLLFSWQLVSPFCLDSRLVYFALITSCSHSQLVHLYVR